MSRPQSSEVLTEIPTMIYSAIDEPEWANSLGASRCVARSVTQKPQIDALEELHI